MTPGTIARIVVVMFLWAVCFPLILAGFAHAPDRTFATLRAFRASAARRRGGARSPGLCPPRPGAVTFRLRRRLSCMGAPTGAGERTWGEITDVTHA